MCTEGLHGLLNKAATEGAIHGVSLCRYAHKLTHLMFADDSIFFVLGTNDMQDSVLKILKCYCDLSGQNVILTYLRCF